MAKTRIEWKYVYENQDFDADSFNILNFLSQPTGPHFCQPCIWFYKDIEKDTIEFNKYLRIDFISLSLSLLVFSKNAWKLGQEVKYLLRISLQSHYSLVNLIFTKKAKTMLQRFSAVK